MNKSTSIIQGCKRCYIHNKEVYEAGICKECYNEIVNEFYWIETIRIKHAIFQQTINKTQ